MRLAIAQPCLGSSETVLKRSSVPWTKSFGFAILWLSTIRIVDCQGWLFGNGRHYDTWEISVTGLDPAISCVTGRCSFPLNCGLAGSAESGTDRSAIVKVQHRGFARLGRQSDECVAFPTDR